MRLAKVEGSSREKPEVKRDVSYKSQMTCLTVLYSLSAATRSRRVVIIELLGLTSKVFLDIMYEDDWESRRAWAFMIRSMFADQPNSPVTRHVGALSRRLDTTTFSTLSSRISFISLQSCSVCALSSSN